MAKKVTSIILFLVIFSMVALFSFYYYIKPQRELIRTKTEDCVSRAMSQVNGIVKNTFYSGTYTTEAGISNMLEDQNNALEGCRSNYVSILFSEPERKLFELSLDAKINEQKGRIDSYNASVKNALAEGKKRQDKKQACVNMQAEYDKYNNCLSKDVNAGLNAMDCIYDQSKCGNDPCLKKYNYKRFGVDLTDCMFIDSGLY
jgi:hypothetical protein